MPSMKTVLLLSNLCLKLLIAEGDQVSMKWHCPMSICFQMVVLYLVWDLHYFGYVIWDIKNTT